MSWFRNYGREVMHLWPAERLLEGQSEAIRHINQGVDKYQVVATGNRAVRNAFRERFGREVFEQVRHVHETMQVSPEAAAAFWEFMEHHAFIDEHGLLVAAKEGTLFGGFMQSDHIIRQSIHRMLRDGPVGHAVRRPAFALAGGGHAAERAAGARHLGNTTVINDGLAMLAPANEVYAYRLTRALESVVGQGQSTAPFFYHHGGLLSKSAREQVLIPSPYEGMFSYQQLLDGPRWIACWENRLPRTPFQSLLRRDMTNSIWIAYQEHDELRRVFRRQFPGLPTTPTEAQVVSALEGHLQLRNLSHGHFRQNWPQMAPIPTPPEELAELQRNVERQFGSGASSAAAPPAQ